MLKKISLICLCLVFVASIAFGSVGVKEETTGTPIQATDIAFVGAELTVTQSGSVAVVTLANPNVIEADTPDSATLAESGTTFIATSEAAGGRAFKLPTVTSANTGTWYKFVNGDSNIIENRQLTITPSGASSSIIYYTASGTAGAAVQTPDAGLGSDSYPTVTIMSVGANWYVLETKGSWEAG